MSAKLIKQFCAQTGVDSRIAMGFFQGDSINSLERALEKYYQNHPNERRTTAAGSSMSTTDQLFSPGALISMSATSAIKGEDSGVVVLKGLHIDGTVWSVAADYSVSLVYSNVSGHPVEALFSFAHPGIPAALYAMTVDTADGQRVHAVAHEKEDAMDVYDDAISAGGSGILLEARSPSSFLVSVGNLPAGEDLKITFRYCSLLTFDEKGAILLDVPLTRYAPPPCAAASGPFDEDVPRGMTLNLSVDPGTPFKSIKCTSGHKPSVSTKGELTKVKCRDKKGKSKAFQMVVKLRDSGKPAAVVESSPEGSAMLCTFFPSVSLREDEDSLSEIIFLVDRSASMQGARLKQTKNALQNFLRAMPDGCYFNIIGFGSRMDMMWRQSQPYNQETFDKASRLVGRFKATLGGTQLVAPLEAIFDDPMIENMPRQIILLTDGDVDNVEEVIALVRKHPSVRIFSIGVGKDAGRRLCEGVSKATNGVATFVNETERIERQCEEQLNRCFSPVITQVHLDAADLPLKLTTPEQVVIFEAQPVVLFALLEGSVTREQLSGKAIALIATISGGAQRRYDVKLDEFPQNQSMLQRLALLSLIEEGGRLSDEELLEQALKLSVVCSKVSLVAQTTGERAATGPMKVVHINEPESTHHCEDEDVNAGRYAPAVAPTPSHHTIRPAPPPAASIAADYISSYRGFGHVAPRNGAKPMRKAKSKKMQESFQSSGFSSSRTNQKKSTAEAQQQEDDDHEVERLEYTFKQPSISRNDQSRSIDILVQLQSYSGAYELTEELAEVLGVALDRLNGAKPAEWSTQCWATALAIATFEKKYPKRAVMVVKKARKALNRLVRGRKNAEPLIKAARKLL